MIGLLALGRALGLRLLLPFAICGDEVNAGRGAVDPDQLAAPVSQSGRRQQHEELLGLEHVERTFDLDLCAGLRHVEQDAAASPRTVRAHQVDGLLVIHPYASRLSTVELHWLSPIVAPRFHRPFALALAAISPQRTVHWL